MIDSVKLTNFRNHSHLLKSFSGGKTIIVAPNGAGKTNLLEAVYLLTNASPSLSRSWEENILNAEENLHIEASISNLTAGIGYERKKRTPKYFLEGKSVTRKKYLDQVDVRAMFLESMDLNIVYLSPKLRRNFFDRIIAAAHPEYRETYGKFQKILSQRNALLKKIAAKEAQADELSYWNQTFAEYASKIYELRLEIATYLTENIHNVGNLLHTPYNLNIGYKTQIQKGDIEEQILAYFSSHLEREIILKKTCIGPHLDDFLFEVKNDDQAHSCSDYLSRGENKMVLLGILLSMRKYILAHFSGSIIFLLDDIFSELDSDHIDLLSQGLGESQALMSTQPNHLPKDLENTEELYFD